MKRKISACLEGLICTALGVFCLYEAMSIRKNPIKMNSKALNILTQAKMLPIVIAVCLILCSISLTVSLYKKGGQTDIPDKSSLIRELIVTVFTVVYLIATYYNGFLVPTVLYLLVMLLYLNWGDKKKLPLIFVLVIVYTAVTIYLVPMMLNFKLM